MEMNFRSYIHFKWIPEKGRERARVRKASSSPVWWLPTNPVKLQSVPPIAKRRSRSCRASRDRDLAALIAISAVLRKIAISDRDRAVDRDLGSRRGSRSGIAIAILDRDRRRGHRTEFVVVDDFFLGCGLCFSEFVFSFFFSKHQKIFSGKFFEVQPNTWKHFPFPEISISEKYVFFGKRFTATKHSLNVKLWSMYSDKLPTKE